jgi:hypothetical protein
LRRIREEKPDFKENKPIDLLKREKKVHKIRLMLILCI